MPHRLLAPVVRIANRAVIFGVLCAALVGCRSTTGGDGAGGFFGYVLAQDFEDERRYLHLGETSEGFTRCLWQGLPPSVDFEWKEIELDPELRRAVVERLEDPENAEHFDADTVAFKEAEPRVCLPRPGEIDFCYAPAMLAGTITAPISVWQFGLTPEIRAFDAKSGARRRNPRCT